MTKRAILTLILIILAAGLNAASPRYQYSYYTRELGFSRTIIQDFDQDGNGCLWLAAWSGLYRFDGTRFSNFTPEKTDSDGRRFSKRFDHICTDAFGRLWALSYDNILYRFDMHKETFSRVDCGKEIGAIYRLASDDIRLVSSDNAILRLRFSNKGQEYHIEEYMELRQGEAVNDIRKDAEDNVWVLTDKALYLNRSVAAARPAYCYEESDGAVYVGSDEGTIVEYINGRFFELETRTGQDIRLVCRIPGTLKFIIGSAESGFSVLNLDDWKLTPVRGRPYLLNAPRVIRDSDGKIWIYSQEGGISLFDPESCSLKPFFCAESGKTVWDAESNILCAFIDSQDNIWIAGSWGGVGKAVLKEYKFSLRQPGGESSDAESKSVRSLLQGSNGIIYAGTKDGKVHLLDKGMRLLTRWDAGEQVYSIAEDNDGKIWLGTKGKGVIENTVSDDMGIPKFRPKHHGESGDPVAPGSKLVYCVRPDSRGRIWIASFDGKLAYSEVRGGKRVFTGVSGIPLFPADRLDRVRYITFSPDGNMFVCGRSGVFRCDNPYTKPELMRFEKLADVAEYDIQHILFASDGKMYASSFGKGFLKFEGERAIRTWTSEDGLLSDFVLSAVEDRSGTIWIVTYKGLNKLNPRTGSITGWSYDRIGHDFLFNEGEPVLTLDGSILLNTTDGILEFNPEEISNSSYTPKVFVRSCYVSGNRVYIEHDAIRMYGRERLIVYFDAVDMSSPESIICSWRIDGGDWTRLVGSPMISLNSLKAGRHRMEMRSTDADGKEANNINALEIIVYPQPIWMMSAGFLLLAGTAAGANLLLRRRRHLRSAATQTGPEETPERLSEEELRFRDAFLAYLESNLDNGDVSSEDIASALHISRSVLFDKCRALLGKAPTEYLRDLRFGKAAEMIAEGSLTISEIAYRTGFNDAHYFSKAFKKRFGVTPSEYRKSFRARGFNILRSLGKTE